ncbi:MAG: LicD family protein [Prevotella sp.]|jgi:lipopolysaccharide cholinephosphotransferase|nr:LicD family protein [Prevotella sp.]
MKFSKDYLNEIAKKENIFYELTEDESTLLKKCVFEMYKDVVQVCEKYNLCIMLGGGSLLGVVRHQGFIPWDDDIDAMMPRQDYNKFREIFEKELGGKYWVSAPCMNDNTEILFMQILKKDTRMLGIDNIHLDDKKNAIRIDIFPIDDAPSNKIIRNIVGSLAFMYRFLVYSVPIYKIRNKYPQFKNSFSYSTKAKFLYRIRFTMGMLLSIFPQKLLFNSFDKFVSSFKGGKFCTIPTGRNWYKGEMLQKEVFTPSKKAIFENTEVSIPNDTLAYLVNLYGDYMKIPPPEKRERHFYIEFSLDVTKRK